MVDENRAGLYLEKILEIKMKTKESYSAAARQRAERMFSKEKNTQMIFDIYESLLKMNEV